MNALIRATQISELEGVGVNNLSMEVLISPFVSDIEKSEYKVSKRIIFSHFVYIM